MAEQLAQVSDDTARLRILDAIKAAPGGAVTVGDVVAKSGVPPAEAERHLTLLVKEYTSDLDVDDDGNLLYRFDPGLSARQDIVEADRKRRRKEAFKKAAIAFFKAWTVVMIVVYAIIYVTLAIMAMIAASSQRRDDRGFGGGGRHHGGGGTFIPIFWGSGSSWRSERTRRRTIRDVEQRVGRGADPYDLRDAREDEDKKPGIIERTWYFLFGQRGLEQNPLEREKELLTYVRAKKGLVTNADIVALLGVPYDEADAIGTRLVATYDGELDITDEGLAVYRFPNLMLSGAPEVQEQVPRLGYTWQVRKKEHALRANPTFLIPFLNGFNLVLAFVTYTTLLPILGWSNTFAHITLVFFPGLFSVLFFAVALNRKLREARAAGQYERDNMRIAIYRLLFQRRRPVVIPGDEQAIAAAGLGSWGTRRLHEECDAIAMELRGDCAARGDGRREIRADRVFREMDVVERLRAQAESKQAVGRTVFSTRGPLEARPIEDDALAQEIARLERE